MDAEFIGAADGPSSYPKLGLPEVAFAGRSNVGKSSLINTMLQRRALARTSKDPGRTRLLGFIRVGRTLAFVDLPGYGYAKVSKTERAHWKSMVEAYLAQRGELSLVCLLVDARREPEEQEQLFVAWLTQHHIDHVVVATKIDKLGRSERHGSLKRIAQGVGLTPAEVIAFSSETGEGRAPLWSRIDGARAAWLARRKEGA